VLNRRLIPKLQMKRSRVGVGERLVLVTTIGFSAVVEIGDPVSQARIFQAQAADELIFLDLDAAREDRSPLIETIRRSAEEIFMPFTVGGGVRSIEDFRLLLANGADKVSVNTAAVEDPRLLTIAADAFGVQCVVVSIDFRRGADGKCEVYTFGGSKPTGLDPVRWAASAQELGGGEILLTSIDCDGTRRGLDLEIVAQVCREVDIPVVVAGGCGRASHFVDGFAAGADGVAAGTYFSFRDENPMQTRSQISNAGYPIRLHT
jgi:cyclase